MEAPADLAAGGQALWAEITEEYDLDVTQTVQLGEACRAKDRCDHLAVMIENQGHESKLVGDANATANLLKQLIAALRLPDSKTGVRPQYRGPRVQKPTVPGGKVASLDRARARKTG